MPSTGEAENFALFGTAAVSVLAGLGLVGYRRRED
ncbi:LPXTG cell wall anchor domain-containing protein [Dolosicoccus paucivorans]|nr:LPXTG cell wall anchor domain-containing protein [Dolosicoccus paucivorans]